MFVMVILLFVSIFAVVNYPTTEIDLWDVFVEAVNVVVCTFLLFTFEKLREGTGIYKALFWPTALLVLGHGVDLLDEFWEYDGLLDFVEEVAKSVGFVVFIFACIKWAKIYSAQLAYTRELAEVDSLTGLSNRRTFIKLAKEYFDLTDKQLISVSLLVIDVDDFKQINDDYGHPAGDKVLVDVAQAIKLALCKEDHVARLGGEEFVVLLKEADSTKMRDIAEQIRKDVQDLTINTPCQKLHCTISLGGATSDGDSASFDELYQRADEAMYEAKQKGKNCYCFKPL